MRQAAVPAPDAFRRAVGRFATGVTVITTVLDGRHLAMTANSFVSVSLDPLLVLVSVRRDARFHDPLLTAGVWGVSVLAADMLEASQYFAGQRKHVSNEQLGGWRHYFGAETGVALLEGAIAVFECRTVSTQPGGDHTLVVGEVVSLAQDRPDAPPLLFYDGAYLAPWGPLPGSARTGA